MPRRVEDGFCLDTYTFEEITERAKEKTKHCRGVKHYFRVAEECCNAGEFELAVEVMQADVNFSRSDAGKAHSLVMIAHIYKAIGNIDKAIQYIDWAIEADPNEKSFKELKLKIEE